MNNLLVKSLAAIAVCAVASMAFARPPAGPPGHPLELDPEQVVTHMTEKLDLNEDQQSQILVLLKSRQDEMKSERARMEKLHRQLMEQGAEFDSDRAREIDEIGATTANLAYARAEGHAQINEILTEDQQAELGEFVERRQDCRRAMGKHRRSGTT